MKKNIVREEFIKGVVMASVVLGLHIFASCCFAIDLSDDDIKAHLIAGSWLNMEKLPDGSCERIYIFYADDTFWKHGTVRKWDEVTKFDYRGVYTIENGIITEIITDSSRPDVMPAGTIAADKIISITENDFIYEYKGEEVRYNRI